MWYHKSYDETLKNIYKGIILGEYNVADSLGVYLDIDYLNSKGLYEEVYHHENTHLQLTTSTTMGHALMFLSTPALLSIKYFSDLFDELMKICFEAQEGAATLIQWYYHKNNFPDSTIESFINGLPATYQQPFDIFNTVAQILVPQEMYWMKGIIANSLGQFQMNTSILEILDLGFQGKSNKSIVEYFSEVKNHPQMRVRELLKSMGEPYSKRRDRTVLNLYECLRDEVGNLSKQFPSLFKDNFFFVGKAINKEIMLINDQINQVFLKFFAEISNLPLSVYHAYQAGEQYDRLLDHIKDNKGENIKRYHFDMSRDIDMRDKFKPYVKKINNSK